jgi:hypothetical protein
MYRWAKDNVCIIEIFTIPAMKARSITKLIATGAVMEAANS